MGCIRLDILEQDYKSCEQKMFAVKNTLTFYKSENKKRSDYLYSFNKQEKTDEIAGEGNHTTAKYWEYDTRLGRRWNLDAIYNTDISRYAVNGNNPIFYLDPNGDFKTKFGAQWYKFWHGTKGNVGQNTTEGSKRNGQWFIQREAETGKKGDGKGTLSEVIVYSPIYGDKKNSKQGVGDPWHQNPFPDIDKIVDNGADKVNRSAKYIQQNASDIWNSPMARAIIPDYYTLSGSFQSSSGIYMNEELTFTLMLRGKDPGLYFNTTTGFGGVSSVGVDVGCSVGKGYYIGDARNLSSSMLGGWQGSGSVGVGLKAIAGGSINGGIDVGLDDNRNPTTITGKVGISVGVGVSTPILQGGGGAGKATNAIPILKF
jgi:hypothetical protein